MNIMELITATDWNIIRGMGEYTPKVNLLHLCIGAGSGADVYGGHSHGYILFRIEVNQFWALKDMVISNDIAR
jgi:hypothetical protein